MIGRREFLAAMGAVTLAGAAPARPNVIMITADDLGYNELSCYGQTMFETPNIDRLAAAGARFTDHYAGAPVCAPSRCCLLTAMHSGHGRVRNNFTPEHGRAGLRKQDFTLAEMFQHAGYRTGIVGKWGLGEEGTEGIPNRKGFDFFYGFLNQNEAHNHYPPYLWRNQEKEPLNGEYAQDQFTKEGARFIAGNAGKQFFLFMAYTLPHADLIAPEEYVARFRGKFPGEGATKGKGKAKSQGSGPAASPNEIFASMMTKLDDDVGLLMALLEKHGLANNTLVLFNGDNGPHNKGRDPGYFHSAGPYRGVKGEVYEGGIRVPLIARWPGRIRPGLLVTEPVAFYDYLPTLAEVAGEQAPRGIDGISFLPALTGSGTQQHHGHLYWEFNQKGTGWQAARAGNWKVVRPGKGEALELYDLSLDPGESKNLAAARPEVVKGFERYLAGARVESKEFPLYADYKGGPE